MTSTGSTTATQAWTLECSSCSRTQDASGLPGVCPHCGDPWLVRHARAPKPHAKAQLIHRPWNMWRYREWMPLGDGEQPVTLGEGMTPLLRAQSLERSLDMHEIWIKDEGQNPCGSFKARGLSAAVTRAVHAGAKRFVIPTAGNAGVALAAYASAAEVQARVYAPQTTPATILRQIELFGGDLHLLDGHIGDCGKAARAYAAETGAVDVSTLREPYRIEGKKTMGLELAEQFTWELPDVVIYPTGGGTGLIGMWKVFDELRAAGWITSPSPRMVAAQAAGCAPVVKAFEEGASATEAWPNPETMASGLRVPAPLGGKLILRALHETRGIARAVTDQDILDTALQVTRDEGIDLCPEGAATVSVLRVLREQDLVQPHERVVLFNTGAGWLYR